MHLAKLLIIILSICLLTSCVSTDSESDISSSISEVSEQSSEQSEDGSQEPTEKEYELENAKLNWMTEEEAWTYEQTLEGDEKRLYELEMDVAGRQDKGLFTNGNNSIDRQVVSIGEEFLGWTLFKMEKVHNYYSPPDLNDPDNIGRHGGSIANFTEKQVVRGVVTFDEGHYGDFVFFYPDAVYQHIFPRSGQGMGSGRMVLHIFDEIDVEEEQKKISESFTVRDDFLEFSIDLPDSDLSLDSFPIQKEVEGGIVAMDYSPVWGISFPFYFKEGESPKRMSLGKIDITDEYYASYFQGNDYHYDELSKIFNNTVSPTSYYCEVEMVGYRATGTATSDFNVGAITKEISFEKLEDNPYAMS